MNSKDNDQIAEICVNSKDPDQIAKFCYIVFMNSKDPDQIVQVCVNILCPWTVKTLTRLHSSVPYCVQEQKKPWPDCTSQCQHIISLDSKDPDQIAQLYHHTVSYWEQHEKQRPLPDDTDHYQYIECITTKTLTIIQICANIFCAITAKSLTRWSRSVSIYHYFTL